VESGGATEGAPAAGAAELIVDITTTGATLAANGLKALADGLILKSEARLAAALGADWDPAKLDVCRRLLAILEARARGRVIASLTWPADQDAEARAAVAPFVAAGEAPRAHGVLVARERLFAAAAALASVGVGPVSVIRPGHVFHATSEAADRLAASIAAAKTLAPSQRG
jgi:ATP phosphoribosyltransferase